MTSPSHNSLPQEAASANPSDTDTTSTSTTTTDSPPSADLQAKLSTYPVHDHNNQHHQFQELYTGPDAAPRTLIVFIRHFFCGSCKEYIRTLSQTLTPDYLAGLTPPTGIVIIGCGDPGLIDTYLAETGCVFPLYADPERKLYAELGLGLSLAMGEKPGYIQRSMGRVVAESVWANLRQMTRGLGWKGGDQRQNGGEFLFQATEGSQGKGEVVWCHRMRNTRDHTEVDVLRGMLEGRRS
ncbi:peroxiredoxin-like family protein [Aspergillus saccharolyticus JOP 1030-1]|uniref:AhpC/TSA antioxidant enzyme-domain-containing protein n=1 Tax=Aspergillus saccharolyticus JOP 1030-1 TaxID=1450539 RepID=A0A318Z943_9EURO|nr:hypothetical protein BP01DRAFT_393922 [Aspergillus saccharolyticus JOP 1030-1]PYH42904.1 hypothetical protein BP01DRAFT_393922 [Aspergillus saccharolyticus JOP 1030-1]